MPIPDIEINEEFIVLVEDELETPSEDWNTVDPSELCQAVIRIAGLRSGENFV
jgi:hypothetical protein